MVMAACSTWAIRCSVPIFAPSGLQTVGDHGIQSDPMCCTLGQQENTPILGSVALPNWPSLATMIGTGKWSEAWIKHLQNPGLGADL